MFRSLNGGARLHGRAGSLVWGYHEAAVLRAWTIRKDKQRRWTLTAAIARVDAFQVRQGRLLFTAPRAEGFWCWPVETGSLEVGPAQLTARLGPPIR